MKIPDEMRLLEEKVEKFEPLITINDRKNIIGHGGDQGSPILSRKLFLEQLPLNVIDKESLKLIHVLRLHQAIDHTESTVGSTVLLRSLAQPSTDLQYIRSKQESLREIDSNDTLRLALRDCVHAYRNGENAPFKFFNKGLYALFPYYDIKKARNSAANIARCIDSIPEAESSYLRALVSYLNSYKESSIHQMMKEDSARSSAERGTSFFHPAQRAW